MPSERKDTQGHELANYRSHIYTQYRSGLRLEPDRAQGNHSLIRDIVSRLPPDPTTRILDAGCGAGELLRLLHTLGYTHIHGVDTSDEQVRLARSVGVDVTVADLFDYLTDRHQAYDVITAVDLIEHFDAANVLRLLTLFRQSLAPGGQLLIRTPNAAGPFGARLRYADLTHGIAFTSSSIKQALRSTGYDQVTVHPQEPAPHGLKSLARLLLWRLIASGVKVYLAIETGVVRGHIVSQNLVADARVGPEGGPP